MSKLKQFLLITLSIIMIFTSSISVYADNAGGGGEGGAGSSNVGGASEKKCGFRMYVVDDKGTLKSKVIDLVYQTPTFDINMTSTRIGNGDIKSSDDIRIMPADMEKPYYYSGSFIGNGMEVKKWMRGKNSSDEQNIARLIYNYLGSDILDLFLDQSNEVFCVLEPIAWHNIYKSNSASSNSGVCFYGTFYNWMQFYSENGLANGGFTRTLDNKVLGRCLTLERDQSNLGLTMPTSGGLLDKNVVGNQGFGIQLYSNLDVEGTHTWDYPLGDTPGMAPISNGKMNIVKNYRTEIKEGEYKDDGCFTRNLTDSTIKIEDEKSYVVVGWKISDTLGTPSSTNWDSTVPGNIAENGTTTQTVKVKKPSNTLYVLLEKAEITPDTTLEADYKLGESQITRAVSLKTDDQGDDILNGYKFKWDFGSLESCGGHRHEGSHTDNCAENCTTDHSYTTYCTFSLNNTDWTFKIKNGNRENYPSNLAINSNWTDYNSEASDTRSGLAAGNIEKEFDHKVVFHRGTDALSLAEWKNTNEALTSLNNFNAVNSKTPTRKKTDYVESVTFSFEDDSSDVTTSSTGTESCTVSDDAELSNPLTTDVGILYKTYSGSISGGKVNTDIDSREMLTIGTSGDRMMSGRMIESGLQFNFHPYIKMRYDTMDSSGNITKDNEILVLGEHKRGMSLNDYAEIIWTKPSKENLTLASGQWSIHAQPVQDVGSNSLLPGGAQMMLGIRNDDRQTITARTYQCILIDDGRTQVEKTDGAVSGYTKETALDFHKAYVQSMMEGIENLSVEQWQNKDYKADPFKGIAVYNEADLSSLKNTDNNRASSDDKYYFKSERGTAQSGCLDVKEGKTTTEYYTFRTDTSGNVYMNNEKILTKDQGVESLTGTALQINNRTLVVTKLLDSVERNSGNDTGATWIKDGKWYNESMDGITVGISTTNLLTGFIQPYERTCILDPKLDTRSSGMSSMFNSYMVGQFKMKNFSTAYGMKYMLGEFKGNAILMNDMDRLYYSKKFYLSNVTTQDLH